MLGFKNNLTQAVIFFAWILQYYTFGSDVLRYMISCLLCVSAILCVLMYDYDYWRNRGVFSPSAMPIVGHIGPVVAGKEQGGICFQKIYNKYKDKKVLGIHQFYRRTLVICDPELIKRVCVNDFMYFTDRGFFFDKDLDPLAESVLYLRGNEWKRLRAKISPIFSPIKLKGMLPLIEDTANKFVSHIQKLFSLVKNIEKNSNKQVNSYKILNKRVELNNNLDNAIVVDSDELVGGYTADAIVPCAFGVKSNVMDNSNDPFAVALGAFYELSFSNIFEKTMRHLWPAFVLFFKMRIIPKKTHDFFYNIVSNVINDRENGVREKRGDFIDMMVALQSEDRNNNSIEDKENDVKITEMVIAANAFIIFLGGYETTSSTLAFLFLELAAHQHIQEKMREEIKQVYTKHDGKMTSEMLQDLSYMDMVIRETLRLYPPFPTIQRICTKDYQIPRTNVVVEKNTIVVFPTLGLHRDDQYFPNASSFDPSRWETSPPPGVYAPFGDGPSPLLGMGMTFITRGIRAKFTTLTKCGLVDFTNFDKVFLKLVKMKNLEENIGKRFALIQMKCCLVKLLPHVRITPARQTQRVAPFDVDLKTPMTLHPADSRVTISLL